MQGLNSRANLRKCAGERLLQGSAVESRVGLSADRDGAVGVAVVMLVLHIFGHINLNNYSPVVHAIALNRGSVVALSASF